MYNITYFRYSRNYIALNNSLILVLENNLVDFPYVIRKHIYSEQSPINILTSDVQYFHLPFLKHNGYFTTVKITNSGYTGKKN